MTIERSKVSEAELPPAEGTGEVGWEGVLLGVGVVVGPSGHSGSGVSGVGPLTALSGSRRGRRHSPPLLGRGLVGRHEPVVALFSRLRT